MSGRRRTFRPSAAVLVAIGSLAWATIATMLDMWVGGFLVLREWDRAPRIMLDRVPWYIAIVVVTASISAIVTISVVLAKESRIRIEHLALIAGLTFMSLTFLTLQLSYISDEIDADAPLGALGFNTEVLGLLLIGLAFVAMARGASSRQTSPEQTGVNEPAHRET